MKIIFAGTPDIAAGVLAALLQNKYDIIACLTQPDRPHGRGLKLSFNEVKQCALQHNIPVLQPKTLKNVEIQQELKNLQPDLMIVLAYGLILPSAVLSIPRLGCINLHASLLPRWRGAAPIQHAILAGDHESGITVMQMDSGLDTGDILATYACEVLSTDTSATLHTRLSLLAQKACLDFLPQLAAGNINRIKQDASLANYAHKIEKLAAQINWSQTAINIDRSIRAYNPWPVAFSNFNGLTVRIWQAEIVSDLKSNAAPGTIIERSKQGLLVNTGDGVLHLLSMQFPGKKMLPVSAICNAHADLKVGARFI